MAMKENMLTYLRRIFVTILDGCPMMVDRQWCRCDDLPGGVAMAARLGMAVVVLRNGAQRWKVTRARYGRNYRCGGSGGWTKSFSV